MFQCSSASRKFLNRPQQTAAAALSTSFSALQRAENSSIFAPTYKLMLPVCFSALQRAENSSMLRIVEDTASYARCFSALQRAENSSIRVDQLIEQHLPREFQCSSASRKFLNRARGADCCTHWKFQCSSASRKFLNQVDISRHRYAGHKFQCSSASRKFLNMRKDKPLIA